MSGESATVDIQIKQIEKLGFKLTGCKDVSYTFCFNKKKFGTLVLDYISENNQFRFSNLTAFNRDVIFSLNGVKDIKELKHLLLMTSQYQAALK